MKFFYTAAARQTASGLLMLPAARRLSGVPVIKTPLLGMKLAAVFILIACLHISAKNNAQKLSLSLKNSSLEKLFTEIGKKAT